MYTYLCSSNINFSDCSPVNFRISNLARLELKESVTTLHSSLCPREDLSVEGRSRDPTRLRGRPTGKRTRTAPTALQRGVLFYDRPTALPPPPPLPLRKSPSALGSAAVFIVARGDDEDRGRDVEWDTERSANGPPPRKQRSAGREGGREGGAGPRWDGR